MRLLLDTHALLWAVGAPARLSAEARELLEDRANELVVSSASAWEVATKFRLGKLPDAAVLVDDWAGVIGRLGAVEIAISARHALYAGSLVWEHRDPFDRVLAAQSVLESIPLVSADEVFASLAGMRVRW
ncbi:type II toxin-antitoxin system VapC family toxin [Microbacterium sp. B2969]|uniref:Type II toxin-antitoxin system VapC family toxin n=1 Tax=Microbacterium alkaliflavum TaxID=3248839 RepID=A0ABW7QBR9_9MICO